MDPIQPAPGFDGESVSVTERTLLQLLDQSPDLAAIGSAEGYLRWISPSWTRLLGWSRDELLSRPFADFIHPADVDRSIAVITGVFEGQDVVGFENRFRRRDGTYVRIEWSAMGRAEDQPLVFSIGRDVTSLHDSQILLSERARMMELAEQLVGIGRWWVDLPTGAAEWTSSIFEIYGLDPADGPPDMSQGIAAYHPDDREMVAAEVGRVAEHGGEFSFQARILRPDGSVRHIEAVGLGHANDEGVVVSLFGLFRDITDELDLQRRVRHAERMASLGTLSAGIAHEVNSPLTWLGGNLEVLLSRLQDVTPEELPGVREELLELASSAASGGERIARIVKGLRAFVHEGGARRSVRLTNVVETAVSLVANEVRHHARLEHEVDPSLWVMGDETQLGQILVNLLINAAQAIAPGHSSDESVRLTARLGDDGWTVIEVQDTGSGMAERDLDRIWDPFFTTKPVGVGSGLGLPIVHGLVEQHGGTIELRSTEDEGTTVTVRFPPSSPESDDSPAPEATVREPLAEPGHLGTLLVVDDEPGIVALIDRCVRDVMTVETAASGSEAIRMLGARPDIDVVCCDMMMPDISGIEVWQWIARERPDLLPRTLVISGGAFTDSARVFLQEHDPPLLSKPFSVKEIRSRLVELARRKVS